MGGEVDGVEGDCDKIECHGSADKSHSGCGVVVDEEGGTSNGWSVDTACLRASSERAIRVQR